MAIDPNIKKKADDIRNKIYGKEVRESLASGLEEMSTDVTETINRQMDLDSQFQTVIDETTGKDVISAPEIIAARNGESNLKDRLDKDYQEITERLANIEIPDADLTNYATINYVDDLHDSTTTQLAQTMINVKDFGAIGDGIADDTNSIQEAINHASLIENVFVYIPEGTYMIKAHVDETESNNYLKDEGGIELLDNIKLLLHGKALLKAIPNDKNQYNILRIYNKTNVQVEGGNIEGDRSSHTGTGGEWGYGIAISGGRNISIKNINIYDCWGDGINTQVYTEGMTRISPNRVYIDNVISNNNRRQGLSIEALTNGVIKNSTFKNTNGTLPSAGIDIEPWAPNNIVENVVIDNCIFEANEGLGLILHGKSVLNIKVKNCYFDDNKSSEGDVSCLQGSGVLFENNVLSKTIRYTNYKNIKMINNKTTSVILTNVENVIIKDNHVHNDTISNISYLACITISHRSSSIVKKNKNITIIGNDLSGVYDGTTPTGNAFIFTNTDKENTTKIKIKDNTIKDVYRPLNTGFDYDKKITPIEFIGNHIINVGNPLDIAGDNWVVMNNIFEGVPNKVTTVFPIQLRATNKDSFIANNVIYKKPRRESDVLTSGFKYNALTITSETGSETNTKLNNTFIDNSL